MEHEGEPFVRRCSRSRAAWRVLGSSTWLAVGERCVVRRWTTCLFPSTHKYWLCFVSPHFGDPSSGVAFVRKYFLEDVGHTIIVSGLTLCSPLPAQLISFKPTS